MYIIKIDDFEGPMDLLISLIKKREMNLFDLQISLITSDFLEIINNDANKNAADISEFLEMASVLLEIKALTVLQKHDSTDPREELVQNLLDYEQLKKANEDTKKMFEIEQRFFKRTKRESIKKDKNNTVDDFIVAYQTIASNNLFKSEEEKNAFEEFSKAMSNNTFTVSDRMDFILKKCKGSSFHISNYLLTITTQQEKVVTFLAVLQLLKDDHIHIKRTKQDFVLFEGVEEHVEEIN